MAGLGNLNNFDDWRKKTNELYRNPLGDTGNYVDDFMSRHGFQPQQAANYEETKDNGWLGWAKDAMDAGAASVFGGQARFGQANSPFGGESFKQGAEYLEDVVQRNSRSKFTEPELTNVNYWLDPQGAWYDVNNMLGSMGALGAETAAVVGAASATPLASVAGAVATKVPALARLWSSPLGKLVIGNVATTPFEAISEGGNLVGQMMDEGYSEEEIQSAVNKAAGMNVAFLGLSNALQSFGATKLLGLLGSPAKAGAKEIVKKGVMGAIGGGITNAGEEAGQSAIGYAAQGKPLDLDEIIASAKAGLVGGLVLGGAGGAGGAAMAGSVQQQKAHAASPSNVVDRVRSLQGALPYEAEDGTNCMRTMGIALQDTPFEGQINVDQAVTTAEENGLLMDPETYTPQPGDMAVVNDGNHIVMVTEDGGTIQNGASQNGVYESGKSPSQMFGNVKYYIQSSIYNDSTNAAQVSQQMELDEDAAPEVVLPDDGFTVDTKTEQKEGVQNGQSENNKNQNSEFGFPEEGKAQNSEETYAEQAEVLNRREATRRAAEQGRAAEVTDFFGNIAYPDLSAEQAKANVQSIKRQTTPLGGFMPDAYYTNKGEFKDRQKMKDTIAKMRQKHLDQQWYGMERNRINAGLEGIERDAADFITSLHPDNPAAGLKIERERLQRQYDGMLAPVIDELKSGMKQGVEVIRTEGEGRGYRASRNAQWYSDFYKQHKRAPNQGELKQIAYDVLSGQSSALPGWQNDSTESAVYFKDSKAILDGLREQITALDTIENKMPERFEAVDEKVLKEPQLVTPTTRAEVNEKVVVKSEPQSETVQKANETVAEQKSEPAAEPQEAPAEDKKVPMEKTARTPKTSAERIKSDGTEEVTSKKERIEDFGEKIGGARKDIYAAYADLMNKAEKQDVKEVPLSKSWPEPDYQKLLDEGGDKESVAMIRSLRDAVPQKPRASYRLPQWANMVKVLRDASQSILNGGLPEHIRIELKDLNNASHNIAHDFASEIAVEVMGRTLLYEAVGHKYSLKDIRIKDAAYSLYHGQKFNPPKVLWTIEQKTKKSAFSNFPRELAVGDTLDEAIDKFKKAYDQIMTKETKKPQATFDIYARRGQAKGSYFIGKKIGRNIVPLKEGFESGSEAREYRDAHQDELVDQLQKIKEVPFERRDTNNPRVGEDMRGGQDVTPQMFSDAFGFRGVEFGNWVENDRRQRDLNDAYDALMDMAGIIGVHPKALSLNGELGIAFGARGAGGKNAASAHYEPNNIVINLTKKSGAGSLAHEWWHAVDNYFSRLRKQGSNHMLDASDVRLSSLGSKYIEKEGVRKEMVDAFGNILKAINESEIPARSSKLDRYRSKSYWTQNTEMGARAYESYIIAKLQDQNAANDYLANIVDENAWDNMTSTGVEKQDSYPYPKVAELPQVRAAFDNFFNVVEQKETDKGIALYSINTEDEQLNTVAMQEWEDQVKDSFPSARNFSRDGSVMEFDLPNGQHMRIDIVERIILDDTELSRAQEDYGGKIEREDKVIGSIRTVGRNAFMTLTQDNVRGTTDHEALHYARTHGLAERENAALDKKFGGDEEAMAEAYRKWRIKWKERREGSDFGKLWRKVYDFAAKVADLLGFETEHDVFRKVESGEVWERTVEGKRSSSGLKLFSLFSPKEQEKWVNYGKTFRENIQAALDGKVQGNKPVKVCDTPLILQELGIPDLPIKMRVGLAANTTKETGSAAHAHELTLDMLEQIPQALNEPVFVMKSATVKGDVVIFTDIKDRQGRSVIVPLAIQKDIGNKNIANVIKSIYGRKAEDLFVTKQVLEKNLLYANTEKSLEWLTGFRLQLPDLITKQSSLLEKSISEKLQGVNADVDAKYSIFAKNDAEHRDSKPLTGGQKVARAFSNIERKGTVQSLKEWLADKRKNLYRDWIDKNDALHDVDAAVEQGVGRKLTDDEKIYNKAQTMKANASGMANALIEGDENNIKAVNARLKNKKLPHVATLAMALEKVDRKSMDSKYGGYLKNNGLANWIDALGTYLGSIRLLEMNRLHKEAYQQKVEEWEANGARGKKPVYKPYKLPANLIDADLREFIRLAPREFKEAASLYWMFNDNLLTVMEDAGMISAEAHELLNTKYKYYAPLMRDFSDTAAADNFIGGLQGVGRGIANISSTLKTISVEGSERGIINPLESSLKAAAVVCARAERNKVGQMAVQMAADGSMGNVVWVAEGKSADPKNCIFTVMENGKKVAYQTIPEFYGPIAGYNEASAGFVLGLARNTARMLRAGATSSPSFIVRNLIRDTFFAGVSSKTGFIPFVDTVRGMYALAKNPQLRAEFEAAGVNQYNFYSSAESVSKSLDEMAGGKDWREYGAGDMWNAFMKYPGLLSEFVESSSRMGEFMRARKQGVSIDEAARYARELTLDFSRSGVQGEKVNQIVPFFNACLQGGDKMIRLLKDNPVGTMTALGKYIVLPSVILWALNHDEDWYKELDPNIKNTCWCLPGGIRIPKPQEAGVFFGSGIEMILDMATKTDPEAMGEWAEAFKDAALPNFVPTLFLPMLEWQANYSYFRGQPITGKRLERLPDEMQFNPGTSEVAKAVGQVLKVSPVKVDNTIRGYTGTMGMFLAQSLDPLVAEKRNLPTKKFSELTFVRDFMLNDNVKNRSVNDFYDMLDTANKQHAGYGVKGKPAAAVQLVRKAGQLISSANKDIRNITTSTLSPDEKRARIDKKKAYIQNVAKAVNAKFGKFFN